MILIIFQILFVGDCRGNHTVHTACGPGNGCMGSMENWICICDADGWRAVEGDMKKCHKSKNDFLSKVIRVLLQPWTKYLEKSRTILTRPKNLDIDFDTKKNISLGKLYVPNLHDVPNWFWNFPNIC